MAQLATETDQPRSEPHLTPQRDIGWHDIAESRSCVKMIQSVTPKSLYARGHMHIKENDYESSPQL